MIQLKSYGRHKPCVEMDVQFLNRRKISHFTVVNLAAILIERTSVLQLTLARARVNFQMIFLSIACRKLVSKVFLPVLGSSVWMCFSCTFSAAVLSICAGFWWSTFGEELDPTPGLVGDWAAVWTGCGLVSTVRVCLLPPQPMVAYTTKQSCSFLFVIRWSCLFFSDVSASLVLFYRRDTDCHACICLDASCRRVTHDVYTCLHRSPSNSCQQ